MLRARRVVHAKRRRAPKLSHLRRPSHLDVCACADFAASDLGACKHIEFILGRLEGRRGGVKALKQGFHPAYSEIYLQYGGERQVRFRAGSQCPPVLARRAAGVFSDPNGALPLDRLDEIEGLLIRASRLKHEIRCYEDALGCIAQARDAEERRRILREAYAIVLKRAIRSNSINLRRTNLFNSFG